jgi:spermidine synthase
MPPNAPPPRFLNQSVLNAAAVFSHDVTSRTLGLPPSTFHLPPSTFHLPPSTPEHPRIVEDLRHGYD